MYKTLRCLSLAPLQKIYVDRSPFLLLLILLTYFDDTRAGSVRIYVVRKDFLNGIKSGEFSVYDSSGKQLQYRIESKFALIPDLELVAYPSKTIVGKLKGKWGSLTYTILDDRTGQWISGQMKQHFTLKKHFEYNIEWNGRQISIKKPYLHIDATFRDESQGGTLLAQYQQEPISFIWRHTYTVKVYSDDLPDGIYLLALAWIDQSGHHSTTKG